MNFARISPRNFFLCAAAFTAVITVAAGAATKHPPQVRFNQDGVTIGNVEPGDRVAWISVQLENPMGMTRMTVKQGIDAGNASRSVEVKSKNADRALMVWLIAQIDGDGIGYVSPPEYTPSAHSVTITASAGAAAFTVRAPSVELLYVRPDEAAWTFKADDGSALDGDGIQNGIVMVPLHSLEPFRGHAAAPATVRAGDAILVVDLQWMKIGQVEVQP